jgi:ubiquitin C-terminal hydrolase
MSQQMFLSSINQIADAISGNGSNIISSSVLAFELSFVSRGLTNRGNTCFIASILQCLNSFKSILNELHHHRNNFRSVYLLDEFQLVDSYVNLVYQGFNSNCTLTESQFEKLQISFFEHLNSNDCFVCLTDGQQHDAQEFLSIFMNYIDECMAKVCLAARGVQECENVFGVYEEILKTGTVMSKSFSLETSQILECSVNPSHLKRMVEFHNHLQVCVNEWTDSLTACLRNYFEIELVHAVDCNQCQAKRIFRKDHWINRLGDNLIIMLKRFEVSLRIRICFAQVYQVF